MAVGQGRSGGAERGARLLGAAAAPLLAQWHVLTPWARRDHEQWLAAARAALGDAAFAAAFAAGQALPFTEALALAQLPDEAWDQAGPVRPGGASVAAVEAALAHEASSA